MGKKGKAAHSQCISAALQGTEHLAHEILCTTENLCLQRLSLHKINPKDTVEQTRFTALLAHKGMSGSIQPGYTHFKGQGATFDGRFHKKIPRAEQAGPRQQSEIDWSRESVVFPIWGIAGCLKQKAAASVLPLSSSVPSTQESFSVL